LLLGPPKDKIRTQEGCISYVERAINAANLINIGAGITKKRDLALYRTSSWSTVPYK